MKDHPFYLGTMRWGTWGANFTDQQACSFLLKSYELGFRTFDLADIYGDYTTEKLFGKALSLSGIERKEIYIITKCGIQLPGNYTSQTIKSYNTSDVYIRQQLQRSLENINTEYIDEMLIHRPSPLMDMKQIAHTFSSVQKEKTVKNFGVSNFSPLEFSLLNDLFPLKSHQIEFSLIETKNAFNGTFQQLNTLNKEIQIWSPLVNYFQPDCNVSIKDLVKKMTKKYDASESQILLVFILKIPGKPKIALGTTQWRRLCECVESVSLELENEDWFYLLEYVRGKEVD